MIANNSKIIMKKTAGHFLICLVVAVIVLAVYITGGLIIDFTAGVQGHEANESAGVSIIILIGAALLLPAAAGLILYLSGRYFLKDDASSSDSLNEIQETRNNIVYSMTNTELNEITRDIVEKIMHKQPNSRVPGTETNTEDRAIYHIYSSDNNPILVLNNRNNMYIPEINLKKNC